MMRQLALFAVALGVAFAISGAPTDRDSSAPQRLSDAGLPHNLLPLVPLAQSARWRAHDEAANPFNVRVHSDATGQLQNEQQIGVNPTDPDNLVAVWRDFRLGYRQVGLGHSVDGGASWTDALAGNTPFAWDSDPGLAWDAAGRAYAVILSYESAGDGDGLYVLRSDDGGSTWQGPGIVTENYDYRFEDKELIACDAAPGSPHLGNVYVVWKRFYTGTPVVYCCRSTNGAQSFDAPVRVSSSEATQWPVAAVGAAGEVWVAWTNYSSGTIEIDVSHNGGLTFGNDRLLQQVSLYPGSEIRGGILVFPYPAMDVDLSGGSAHGTIYVAFPDYPEGGGMDLDIWLIRSTDGGNSWSPRLRVNDDAQGNGRDQFHPWLDVDEFGTVHVTWLDRRLDSANTRWNCYLTRSYDQGVTFTSNMRVSTQDSSPSDALAGLLGEYIGVSAGDERIHPLWVDTRNGNQDSYTATIDLSNELEVLVIPRGAPLRIPAGGGSIEFDGYLSAGMRSAQAVDVWAMVDLPGGGRFGPILDLRATLPGESTRAALLSESVPANAPPGNYRFVAYAQSEHAAVPDSSEFTFVKLP